MVQKSSSQYRTLGTIDGEPMEFEWNIFTGFTNIAALQQSPRVPVECEHRVRNISQDESSSCQCLTTSHGGLKKINRNAN